MIVCLLFPGQWWPGQSCPSATLACYSQPGSGSRYLDSLNISSVAVRGASKMVAVKNCKKYWRQFPATPPSVVRTWAVSCVLCVVAWCPQTLASHVVTCVQQRYSLAWHRWLRTQLGVCWYAVTVLGWGRGCSSWGLYWAVTITFLPGSSRHLYNMQVQF